VDIILVVALNRKDAKSINKNLTKTKYKIYFLPQVKPILFYLHKILTCEDKHKSLHQYM